VGWRVSALLERVAREGYSNRPKEVGTNYVGKEHPAAGMASTEEECSAFLKNVEVRRLELREQGREGDHRGGVCVRVCACVGK
jgi:hypothetical protein